MKITNGTLQTEEASQSQAHVMNRDILIMFLFCHSVQCSAVVDGAPLSMNVLIAFGNYVLM